MGIIKRVRSDGKRIVRRRRENVTPEYFAWAAAAKQSELADYLNFGAGLSPLAAARQSAEKVMLRAHHLMSYRSIANWPPVWLKRRQINGSKAITVRATPRGEIGILKDVFVSMVNQPPRIFLIVAHDGGEYIGTLLFADRAFCRQIYELLKRHCGKTIAQVGALELSPSGSEARLSAEKVDHP